MIANVLILLVSALAAVDAQTTDVAIGKKIIYCTTKQLPETVTDGKKQIGRPSMDPEECPPTPKLDIKLGNLYYVNYVVFYTGKVDPAHNRGEMDYLAVENTMEMQTFFCGQYPFPMILPKKGEGRRINCANPFRRSDGLELYLYHDKGYNLAALEVMAFTTHLRYDEGFFRGCFKHFPSMMYRELETRPYFSCIRFCSLFRYPFAAIRDKSECRCSYQYDYKYEVSQTKCDLICTEENVKCGGKKGYHAVYVLNFALPYYVGCKSLKLLRKDPDKKQEVTEKGFKNNDMTVAKCIKFCEDFYTFYLTNGDTCNCTNDRFFPEAGGQEDCNITCTGDQSSFCGGTNNASIYSTCMVDTEVKTKCSSILRCETGYDEYGMCVGGCQSSFTGDHCLTRDQNYDFESDCVHDDPCKKIAFTDCTMDGLKPKCFCWPGFRPQIDGSCNDIDECKKEDACDATTSACVNLNGTYLCQCKPGHVRKSNFTCAALSYRKKIISGIYVALLIILPILSSITTGVVCWCIRTERIFGGKKKSFKT